MYILGIETTGPVGSVALYDLDGDRPTALKTTEEPMGHLRNLMAMASDLLEEAGAVPSDIQLVACSVGPGSYTGIRIGVTSARAIAQALGVPCVPVGALDQFRQVAMRTRHPLAVIFNARRGQVYGAVYRYEEQERTLEYDAVVKVPVVVDVLPPGPYMLTDVLEKTADLPGVVFYGDGVDAYREQLEGMTLAPETERYPSAALTVRAAIAEVLHAAEAAAAPGELEPGTTSFRELLPRYMRETEAEQKLKDGTLAKLRAAKMAKFRSR